MRIAFVGKGGSGKTTVAALFSLFLADRGVTVLAVDADINVQMHGLLGLPETPIDRHLSANAGVIREHLRGTNPRITDAASFKKTTPPGAGSRLVSLIDPADPLVATHATGAGNLRLLTVGSYGEEDIGTSCYHNSLATFENLLSHLDDRDGVLVADMVAGTDAFAGTLHAQFDLVVIVVEPTRRSVDVFEQYRSLAEAAGAPTMLAAVGNKIATDEDGAFLRERIPAASLLGLCRISDAVRSYERDGSPLTISTIDDETRATLAAIADRLQALPDRSDERLRTLWKLHRAYVAQPFVRERFGDLTTQIDESFSFPR